MRFLLTTETDCHSSLHWDAVSTGTRSDHTGFLNVRREGVWLKKSWYTGHAFTVVFYNLQQLVTIRQPCAVCWVVVCVGQLCRAQSVRNQPHRAIQLLINQIGMSRSAPDWTAVLCCYQCGCTKGVCTGSPARSDQLGQEVIPGFHFSCCLL